MDKNTHKRKQIAERIATLLEAKGWNQQTLADKTGRGKSYISSIMACEANLTLSTIVDLEEALKAEIVTVPRS